MLDTVVRVAFLVEVEVNGPTLRGRRGSPVSVHRGSCSQGRREHFFSCGDLLPEVLSSWPFRSSSFLARRQFPESIHLRSKLQLADRVKPEFLSPGPGTQLLSCFFRCFLFVCELVRDVKREEAVALQSQLRHTSHERAACLGLIDYESCSLPIPLFPHHSKIPDPESRRRPGCKS